MKSEANKIIRIIILGFAVLGCADALYILLTKYQCIACQSIHNSIWGKPFGIPVALFGLCAYLTLFVLVVKNKEWLAFIFATVGFGISFILVYAQFVILESLCVFCLVSAIIMLSIWLLLLIATCKKRTEGRKILVATLIVLVIFIAYQPAAVNLRQKPSTKAIASFKERSFEGNDLLELRVSTENSRNKFPPIKEVPVNEEKCQRNDILNKTNIIENKKYSEQSVIAEINDDTLVPNTQQAQKDVASSNKLLVVFGANGSSVNIDMSENNVLFFSPSCEACSEVLAQVARITNEKRPILIDTYIENEKEKEIQEVHSKLSKLSLDPNTVLYDFDHYNPVNTIPALMSPDNLGTIPVIP